MYPRGLERGTITYQIFALTSLPSKQLSIKLFKNYCNVVKERLEALKESCGKSKSTSKMEFYMIS